MHGCAFSLAAIDVGRIVELSVSGVLVAAVAALIAAFVTVQVIRGELRGIAHWLERVEQRVDAQDQAIDRVVEARSDDAQKAGNTYATRAELARLVSDQTNEYHANRSSLSRIHDRITELATQVAELRGAQGAAERGEPPEGSPT